MVIRAYNGFSRVYHALMSSNKHIQAPINRKSIGFDSTEASRYLNGKRSLLSVIYTDKVSLELFYQNRQERVSIHG
jgi:hypothetical protein